MTDMTDDRFGGERALVNWPAEVAEEPNYPTLSPPALDLVPLGSWAQNSPQRTSPHTEKAAIRRPFPAFDQV